MITGEQIKAARALTRLDQAELASRAGLSAPTIKRLEQSHGPISANTKTEAQIRHAFAEAGVDFIDPNDDQGAGVRLRK